MTCCENKESCKAAVNVKEEALKLGVSPDWIATLIELYGEQVLVVVVQVLREGLNPTLIMGLLRVYGPRILQFLLDLFSSKNALSATYGGKLNNEESFKSIVSAAFKSFSN